MPDPRLDPLTESRPYYDEDGIQIWHGDCRHIDAWDIVGGVMVTDPPYGISHSSNRPNAPLRGEQIDNDHDTTTRDEILRRWGSRPAIVFGTCSSAPPPIKLRGVLVWDKGGHVGMGDLAFPWKQNWEHIYIAGVGFTGRRDTGVIRSVALAPFEHHDHPHQKPIGLMGQLIDKCPPLATIVDPFMGSGSTLVAAQRAGRSAIGVEVDERYCEIAVRRLAQRSLFAESL